MGKRLRVKTEKNFHLGHTRKPHDEKITFRVSDTAKGGHFRILAPQSQEFSGSRL